MRTRILQIALVFVCAVSGIMLFNLLRDGHWMNSSWKSILMFLPEAGLIFAVFELEHSAKANELREQLNGLVKSNSDLTKANAELQAKLDHQRNERLAEIAKGVQRPQSLAERNALKLRQYVGEPVAVRNHDGSRWGIAPSLAEISDDNIAALFLPAQGSQATAQYVECDQLEILEVPQGNCRVQLTVKRYYGSVMQLGEIKRWEDRKTPAAAPIFEKGVAVVTASFTKPGSSERRELFIFAAKDGTNSFMLESSVDGRFIGDNRAVSIRFLSLQVELFAAGFQRSGFGTGGGPHPLFVS